MTVPSFSALTPGPAVACVTPAGSSTSGQYLRQLAAQATWLGLSVYTVCPLARIVPNLALWTAEMTSFAADRLDAAAPAPGARAGAERPAASSATAAARAPWRMVPRLVVWRMSLSPRRLSPVLRAGRAQGLPGAGPRPPCHARGAGPRTAPA